MSGPVPPGAPRQQAPPAGLSSSYQQIPNSLTDNFQNMNLNRPPSVSGSFTRPLSSPYPQASPFPPVASSPPFGQPPSSSPFVQPPSSSPFVQPPSSSPFGQPPSSSPFGQPPSSSPFGQPPSSSPFGQPPSSYNQPSYASSAPVARPGPPPSGMVPRSAAPFPGGIPPVATISSAAPPARPTLPSAGNVLQPSRPMMGGGALMAPPAFSTPGVGPSPPSSEPVAVAPPGAPVRLASNGPPMPGFQGGPRFPPAQPPPMGPYLKGGDSWAPSQPQTMWPAMGTPGASVQNAPPPFSGTSHRPRFAPPSDVSGQPLIQPPPMGPSIPGSVQPPRMHGMPLPPNQMTSISPVLGQGGSPMAGQSKIDPNQIPRPVPNSSVIIHETRYGNQANPPPPAISDYIVRDTGNCSPRFLRCTISQVPCTGELLTTSGMQLALLVQPLAIPHSSEDPVQVVDFGESGPVRCSRCKGYVNPFMKFIDQGRRFVCNLCGFTDETPRDYVCNLGPDGRRRDADERPELCRGTVEFVATKEYMVREPMPAVYFFVVDVSMNAIQTGATAAACSSINQVLSDLPEGPRTMVGIATFDSTVHFYNLKRALQQPLMLIVPDVQDVYTPLETDVIVPLTECRQHLEFLLENIPSMFESSRIPESAFGAAMKASFLAIKSTGGKLLVFQSVLPSLGIGALSSRESEGRSNVSAGDKEVHKLLQPADKTLKEMAIEFAEFQVCVDVFLTAQSYVDIASISVVPRTTGGQVYYYYPFSAVTDPAKLYNDLRWNITRPQGFEAVMRVRCSQGIQVQDYSGNFCKRIPTDVDLPAVDCDKTLMVTLKHDDKLQDGSECSFQCALLYTTIYGQRRIRISTLSLSCTNNLSNLFRMADLDSQFVCFLKLAASQIPSTPPVTIRDQAMNFCINILLSYRKFCATVSSSGQLILPEALKLLPLYTLALLKSTGLRPEGRLDDQSFWISYVSSVSAPLAIPLVSPRLIAIHNLVSQEFGGTIPPSLPLSSEHLSDDGIYLLENGLDGLIYVGNSVDKTILYQLFGISTVDEIPTQFVLSQYDNALSTKLNDVVNEIRRQRCSFLRLRLCKKGDQSGMLFLSSLLEDKVPTTGYAYVEFLVHIHRQIQMKMSS